MATRALLLVVVLLLVAAMVVVANGARAAESETEAVAEAEADAAVRDKVKAAVEGEWSTTTTYGGGAGGTVYAPPGSLYATVGCSNVPSGGSCLMAVQTETYAPKAWPTVVCRVKRCRATGTSWNLWCGTDFEIDTLVPVLSGPCGGASSSSSVRAFLCTQIVQAWSCMGTTLTPQILGVYQDSRYPRCLTGWSSNPSNTFRSQLNDALSSMCPASSSSSGYGSGYGGGAAPTFPPQSQSSQSQARSPSGGAVDRSPVSTTGSLVGSLGLVLLTALW